VSVPAGHEKLLPQSAVLQRPWLGPEPHHKQAWFVAGFVEDPSAIQSAYVVIDEHGTADAAADVGAAVVLVVLVVVVVVVVVLLSSAVVRVVD